MILPASYQPALVPIEDPTTLISIATHAQSTIHPNSRRTESISYYLPIIITVAFLIVLALTALLARCLYARFKSMRLSPSSSSNWKSYHSSRLAGSANSINSHLYDDQDLDENDPCEHDGLLARRRSTSYYDANRSRAPTAVTIKHDSKGRPISTWSTASSVAAQRGEELSQWSKKRDDLLKIYGRSNYNTNSFATYDDLEEEPEQPQEEEEGGEEGEQERIPRHGESLDTSQATESYSPRNQSNELSMTKKGGRDIHWQDEISGLGVGK